MRFWALSLLVSLGVTPAWASVQCGLSATQEMVRQEGLAEPLGEILLSCTGAAPGAPLAGALNVMLSVPFANRETDGMLDAKLSVDAGSGWLLIAGAARAISSSNLLFENIAQTFSATGSLSLRVSNLRASGAHTAQAVIAFAGATALPFPATPVTVSVPSDSVLAAKTSFASCAAAEVPAGADFESLLALRVPFTSTRITEGFAASLLRRQTGADAGSRIVVRWASPPPEVGLLVPDFVAGSSALSPTAGGDMGVAASPGRWAPSAAGSLLLGRVNGADERGRSGSVAAFSGVLGSMSSATRASGSAFAVYEVLDSNPSEFETAQFPAFLVFPSKTAPCRGGDLHQQVSLAPIDELSGASATAPIPRFRSNFAGLDCRALNDCAAPWFPRLSVYADKPLEFNSPQNSGPQTGFLRVTNQGGGLLEWTSSVRYLDGSGWVALKPDSGLEEGAVAINVTAGNLPLGSYRAEVTIVAPPPSTSFTFAVRMNVAAPLPPQPKVREVVNAGNRIAGPLAPGSLAVIVGEQFQPAATATVSGRKADVLTNSGTEMLVLLPGDLAAGGADLTVRNSEAAATIRVQIAAVAPAVMGVLNQDSSRNSDANPARPGDVMQVFGTGLREQDIPLTARIHDRVIEQPIYAGSAPGLPGMMQFNFQIPADLPAMSSEVFVCGRGVCSRAFAVTLR